MVRDFAERVSYLQGLSEGLNISDGSPQGKIISGILGVLEDMSDTLVNIQYDMEEFKEYVESIDDDLFELEESLLDEEDWDDSREYIEVKCGNCGEELYFDADILDDDEVIEIICPHCNDVVFINDGSFDHEYAIYDDEIEDDPEVFNPNPS